MAEVPEGCYTMYLQRLGAITRDPKLGIATRAMFSHSHGHDCNHHRAANPLVKVLTAEVLCQKHRTTDGWRGCNAAGEGCAPTELGDAQGSQQSSCGGQEMLEVQGQPERPFQTEQ